MHREAIKQMKFLHSRMEFNLLYVSLSLLYSVNERCVIIYSKRKIYSAYKHNIRQSISINCGGQQLFFLSLKRTTKNVVVVTPNIPHCPLTDTENNCYCHHSSATSSPPHSLSQESIISVSKLIFSSYFELPTHQ